MMAMRLVIMSGSIAGLRVMGKDAKGEGKNAK